MDNFLVDNPDFTRLERLIKLAELNCETSRILGNQAIPNEAEEDRGRRDVLWELQAALKDVVGSIDQQKAIVLQKLEEVRLEFEYGQHQWRSDFFGDIILQVQRTGVLDGRETEFTLQQEAQRNSIQYLNGRYKAISGLVLALNAAEDPTKAITTGIFFQERKPWLRIGPIVLKKKMRLPGRFMGSRDEFLRESKERGVDGAIDRIVHGTRQEIAATYNAYLRSALHI